jgi:hypothetical protein
MDDRPFDLPPFCRPAVARLSRVDQVANTSRARQEEAFMHAVIGRVRIKPGHEDETRQMITDHGVAMVQGMDGSVSGCWSRSARDGDLVQHSFWLFDTEDHARAAEATFLTLRDMPDAPATFISVDVCEVIGQT